jgi:hypothetical protein
MSTTLSTSPKRTNGRATRFPSLTKKEQARIPGLLNKVHPEAIGVTLEHWHGSRGLKQICVQLCSEPLSTTVLHVRIGGHIEVLRSRLREGVRAGLIRQQRRYKGEKGHRSSQQSALWHLCGDGVRQAAAAKPARTYPIESLPKKLQRILNEADWQIRGLTNHQAWCVANLVAVVHVNPGITKLKIKELLGDKDYATVRQHVKWAEDSGAIRVHRPTRKGVMGRPANRYEALLDDIESWRNPKFVGRVLSPGRSLKTLAEMQPPKDHRTPEQRRWCQAIHWKETGLCSAYDWLALQKIVAAIGKSRIITYEALAQEIGCGENAIEKVVRRAKKAELIELKQDAGGRSGRETEWIPKWDRIKSLAGEQQKPSTNGRAKKRTAKEPAEAPAAALTTVVKPQWDAERRNLRLGDQTWAVAKQAKRILEALRSFEEASWREKIDSPFSDNSQAHRDVIFGLNKCCFLKFSSALSGTAIAWKKADF